ncbi:MAG: glutathione peroxidase [bacterium]|nr:glutathione peroxidase [bacterium]
MPWPTSSAWRSGTGSRDYRRTRRQAPRRGTGIRLKNVILIFAGALVVAVGIVVIVLRGALAGGAQAATGEAPGTLWAFTPNSLEGKPAALSQWKGQVALVVNTASKCGLTPQYKGLESLYRELKDQGFVVLGFPSNDFMGQEPGTAEEIRSFCDTNYQVSFPLFAKVKVKGDGRRRPLLVADGRRPREPTWNFTKYLVGRDGKVIARFGPKTAPDDAELRAAITKALGGA